MAAPSRPHKPSNPSLEPPSDGARLYLYRNEQKSLRDNVAELSGRLDRLNNQLKTFWGAVIVCAALFATAAVGVWVQIAETQGLMREVKAANALLDDYRNKYKIIQAEHDGFVRVDKTHDAELKRLRDDRHRHRWQKK